MKMAFSDDTELFPLSTLLHNRMGDPVGADTLPPNGNIALEGGAPTWARSGHKGDGSPIIAWMSPDEAPTDISIATNGTKLFVKRFLGGKDYTSEVEIANGTAIQYLGAHVGNDVDGYWGQFGIEHVELPDNTPLVHAMWDRICLRVNEAYYDRFLGGETLEQWQRRLQVITDRIIPRYERNFRIYKDNKTKLETELGMAQTTEYLDVKDTFNADTENKMSDTPDTAINEDQKYAGTVTKGTVQNSNTKTGAVRTTTTGRGGLVDQLNDNMDAWRDLESDLVEEYAKAFLSVIWF